MKLNLSRKKIVVSYLIIIALVFLSAFLSIDNNYIYLEEDFESLNDGWVINGKRQSLPFKSDDEFMATNIIPEIEDNEYLILRFRYEYATIMIGDDVAFSSEDSFYINHRVNSGNKEIVVPLKESYIGKTITVTGKLQKSIYKTSFASATISSGGDYAFLLIRKNIVVLILNIIFLTTGLIEITLSTYFIVKKIKARRKISIEAMLYAGLFSIFTAIWCVCYTRIPAVLLGNMVLPSIIGYIAFLVMPISFLEFVRALSYKKSKFIDMSTKFSTIAVMIAFALCIFGIMEWAQTTLLCHIMDFLAITSAVVVALNLKSDEDSKGEKGVIVMGNVVFVIICCISIANYIKDRESNFIQLFIIALMTYILSMIAYILRRIGLSAEEANNYEIAKVYAYKDDLTGLGNRREYWNEIDKYRTGPIPSDFSVIYMDVNRLKLVNDSLGHDAGDELLLGAAKCINAVFKNAIKCRMGGDEFALIVIMPEFELNKKLHEFRTQVRNWRGETVHELSIAIGVACIREDTNLALDELCRIADDRMYVDKKQFYENNGMDRRNG